MATFLSFRDGGKTDEKGISQHLSGLFTGEVINGLQVVQQSPPALAVNITQGRCLIPSGDDYPYIGFTDSTESVALATADGSNPRIDVIVAYVDLSVVDDATPNNPGAFLIDNVTGTPAGSPSPPNNAAIQAVIGTGNPYIILARVDVAAGATTITNANITDVRVLTGAVLADGSVTTAKIANGAITASKLDSTIRHYGNIYFSSIGVSGGQVIPGSTATMLAFDVLDADSVGITKPANGQLKVSQAGVYMASAHARCSDAPQNDQRLILQASADNGSTWFEISSQITYNVLLVGIAIMNQALVYLTANMIVRARYVNGSANPTRIAAANAGDQKHSAALKLALVTPDPQA